MVILSFLSFLSFFWLGGGSKHSMWKFLGQGSNLCRSSNNTGSLACWTTRKLLRSLTSYYVLSYERTFICHMFSLICIYSWYSSPLEYPFPISLCWNLTPSFWSSSVTQTVTHLGWRPHLLQSASQRRLVEWNWHTPPCFPRISSQG